MITTKNKTNTMVPRLRCRNTIR